VILHSPYGLRVHGPLALAVGRRLAERYGIAYDQVRARKPDVVYFSLSAYGYGGPMGTYRGFEGNAQAVTGLMHRFGGDGGWAVHHRSCAETESRSKCDGHRGGRVHRNLVVYLPMRFSSTSRQWSCTTSIPARASFSAASSFRIPS